MTGRIVTILTRIRAGKAGALLLALLLLVVGALAVAYMVATKRGPSGQKEERPGRLVRVFRAQKASHRVAVTAFGTSRAKEEWTAIAEVSGRAVEVNSRFEPGEVLPPDMLLVRIDPTDYRLAVNRFEAELRARRAEIRQLDQTEANLKAILKLQQRQMRLAAAEYQRQQSVFTKHAGTRSALELAEESYVADMTAVERTRNELALVPAKRDLATAAADVIQAQLDQAKENLGKCELRLPFSARCVDKTVEVNQYVAAGERLGRFITLEEAEVVAMFEVRKLRGLFPRGMRELGDVGPGQHESPRVLLAADQGAGRSGLGVGRHAPHVDWPARTAGQLVGPGHANHGRDHRGPAPLQGRPAGRSATASARHVLRSDRLRRHGR